MRESHRSSVEQASRASRGPVQTTAWLALLLSLAVTGCTSHAKKKATGHDCYDCVVCPTGLCGGYYPTCWRMWPAECPACPVSADGAPVPGPTPVFEPPVEGELVVPPFQSKSGRPLNKPPRKNDLVSHRRPQVVSSRLDRAAPNLPRSGGKPPARTGDAKPPEPSRLPDQLPARKPDEIPARKPDEIPAGGGIDLMMAPPTSPVLSVPAGGSLSPGRATLQVRGETGTVAPVDHPAVAWLFSSANSAAIKSESPKEAAASGSAQR